jgi:DNA-binding winged helix-turn-helix (wHTH) protein
MTTKTDDELVLYRANPSSHRANRSERAAAGGALEFGRFRVLLRRRKLVAGGVPVGLGTRAFDLLLVLLEGDGALVTKDELISRAWPTTVVADQNLKVQIHALRKALGEDRDFIRTEVGRGYRFTAAIRSTEACGSSRHLALRRSSAKPGLIPQWNSCWSRLGRGTPRSRSQTS